MPLFLFKRFFQWQEEQILRRHKIPDTIWTRVVTGPPVLSTLSAEELQRLRRLTTLFLHAKTISGAADFELDTYMRTLIAAQACLLILHLSLDFYDGWSEVIVYPGAFIVPSVQTDDSGVQHRVTNVLGGEAWARGPVLLSWEDVKPDRQPHHNHGVNVVLHEFAHKLDLLNGAANGMPPLHHKMKREEWTEDFTQAYEAMLRHIRGGHRGRIDPYAVESPAEFFAVVTEFFFERPRVLKQEIPAVYAQLVQFYRQDPLQRVS